MCLYMTTITAAMPTVITINTAATRVVRPAVVTLWLCAWFGPGAGEITAGVELRVVGVERWVVESGRITRVGDRPVGELLRVNDSSVKYRIWCI